MDVFELHAGMVGEYRHFTTSFVAARDARIKAYLAARLADGAQWPAPWVSLNPAFESGGTISELVDEGLLTGGVSGSFG